MEELDPIRASFVVIFPIIPLYSPYIGLIYGRYLQLGTWNGHWRILYNIICRIPGSARPVPGGSFETKTRDKKSMAYGNAFETRKQWTVEVVRCINKWANGCGAANNMTWKNPCTTDWLNEPMNKKKRWINEPMKRCITESTSNGAMNKWTNEWTNEWTEGWMMMMNEWMNERMNERTNEWVNECMHAWMHAWMDEWATSLLSYFFTEVPPLSFLLLLWPASALSCLAASSSAASATQFFSSRSQHSAFSNL